ncbi:MAG: hypothetical protein Q9160_008200 [Pyrenula sp. 1 TL-2023]
MSSTSSPSLCLSGSKEGSSSSSKASLSLAVNADEVPEGYKIWPRDPCGPRLTSENRPKGITTPHDQLWASRPGDFYAVERTPGYSATEIWSLSMLGEFGERYGDQGGRLEDTTCWNARPFVHKPFPLLKVPPERSKIEGKDGNEPPSATEHDRELDHSFEPEPQSNGLPPKLEEKIPDCFLPDILLVDDLCLCATGKQGQNRNESKYTTVRAEPSVQGRVFKYTRQLPIGKDITRIPPNELDLRRYGSLPTT